MIIAAACFWSGTLACAYLVGKSSGNSAGDGRVGQAQADARPGRVLTAVGVGTADSPRAGVLAEGGISGDRSGEALARLQGALENRNPVERMRSFMEALALLEADEFGAALDALEKDLRNGENRREISLLLYAWAEKDGAAALAHLDGLELGRDGYSLYYSALTAWGEADPATAEAWAKQKHEGKDGNENYFMVGVINGMAKSDLARASQLTEELGYGRARGEALGVVVEELFKQGDEAAMRWVEAIGADDERFRAGAAGRVAAEIAARDPQAAGEWVLGLGIAERDRAIASVAYEWGRKSPAEAAAWASGIDDLDLRSRGMESVVESWARRDADAAGTWLGQMPATPALDRPVRSYALMVQERDPEAAITWANTITDTAMRAEVVQEVGARWLQRSPEAARAYLQGQEGLPAELQRRVN